LYPGEQLYSLPIVKQPSLKYQFPILSTFEHELEAFLKPWKNQGGKLMRRPSAGERAWFLPG
jgi:hypothetical protein